MELVQSGVAAVVAELNLDLQLILRDVLAAHRAGRTGPRSATGMVRWSGWQFSSADHFSGLRAQNSLVGHGTSPDPAGWSCQMPGGPDACSCHPGEPDGRQSETTRNWRERPETGVGRCSDEDASPERRAFVESLLTSSSVPLQ